MDKRRKDGSMLVVDTMKTGNLAAPTSIATGAAEAAAYRGRLAPSPTGFLHRGHAATFLRAQERARSRSGALILRIEDLDRGRCRPEFGQALLEDLRWAGLAWDEGPDCGGSCGPYRQSERMEFYLAAWRRLEATGLIYPCRCTRRDVERAASAPHAGENEAIYPGCCRPPAPEKPAAAQPDGVNWRFRTEPGHPVEFADGLADPQRFLPGRDFGDFIIWRKDGVPAYQLAVVVDDAAMRVTEVVRGEDLLLSTAQQLLLYRALELVAPAFYHVPLVTDENGVRLAKRAGAHSLRVLREVRQ
jgi:glutamyl/glutaminyl-tRNA synthetase